MAIVTKTIKGRAYRYSQTSQRVAGKVVTKSKYLGAVHPKRKKRDGIGFVLGGFASLGVAALKGDLKEKPHKPPAPPYVREAHKLRIEIARKGITEVGLESAEFSLSFVGPRAAGVMLPLGVRKTPVDGDAAV